MVSVMKLPGRHDVPINAFILCTMFNEHIKRNSAPNSRHKSISSVPDVRLIKRENFDGLMAYLRKVLTS